MGIPILPSQRSQLANNADLLFFFAISLNRCWTNSQVADDFKHCNEVYTDILMELSSPAALEVVEIAAASASKEIFSKWHSVSVKYDLWHIYEEMSLFW